MTTTKAAVRDVNNDGTSLVKWLAIPTSGVGAWVAIGRFPDKTVQLLGTFGAAAAVTMQGSNDGGVTAFTLHDPQGQALTFSSAGGSLVAESPLLIRPAMANGDGSTSVDVYLACVERGK